jgi:MoaA/NifB/PqqE/SkfB family radical SAM enzyme
MELTVLRELRQTLEETARLERYAIESSGRVNVAVPKAPLILRLEVANHCNANCVFCAYRYQKRLISVMSFHIFRQSVDQYIALGGTPINFSPAVGEALIDKDLVAKRVPIE